MELQLTRIEDCFKWLEREFEHTDELQSIDVLIDRMNQLNSVLPWINQQMATAKKILNETKVKAYYNLINSSAANEKYFAPSLAKDFVNARCSEQQYCYDMAERCSRTIVHIGDNLRTCISCLKEEFKISQYQRI